MVYFIKKYASIYFSFPFKDTDNFGNVDQKVYEFPTTDSQMIHSEENPHSQPKRGLCCFCVLLIFQRFRSCCLSTTCLNLSMVSIVIFGLTYNIPRWFELKFESGEVQMEDNNNQSYSIYNATLTNIFAKMAKVDNHSYVIDDANFVNNTDWIRDYVFENHTWHHDTEVEEIYPSSYDFSKGPYVLKSFSKDQKKLVVEHTELRENWLYVKYYVLIGTCLVMFIFPMAILTTVWFYLRRNMLSGAIKHKAIKILSTIIIMFVVCHIPKVNKYTTLKKLYETCAYKNYVYRLYET